jgi:hypothetical protein
MTTTDAEEFTASLGQIVAGSWRQIALAHRLGVPKALGLSLDAWVKERLGGYVRLSIDERRHAALELKADGHSQRQIAQVLGVKHTTIIRDLHPGTNVPPSRDTGENPEQIHTSNQATVTNVPPDDRPSLLAVAQARSAAVQRERREAPQRFAADEIYDSLSYTLATAETWVQALTPHERGRQRRPEWDVLLRRLQTLTDRLVTWHAKEDQ